MNRDLVRERIAAGTCERAGELAFIPLLTLESGARIGLDESYAWVLVPEAGEPKTFGAETAKYFAEIVEQPRARFDDALEAGGREAGLDVAALLLDFPSIELARTILARDYAHLSRLALLWILPSERRELRVEIDRIAKSSLLPTPLKELAERLRVH